MVPSTCKAPLCTAGGFIVALALVWGFSVAQLALAAEPPPPPPPTERLSPQVRTQEVPVRLFEVLKRSAIEPFLAEPLVLDEAAVQNAARIVGGPEDRVLLARGDRAYALGAQGAALTVTPGADPYFQIFRTAKPLIDPVTSEILGYEAQFIGSARLVRGQSMVDTVSEGKTVTSVVPASLEITSSKEELRRGDRLIARPTSPWKDLSAHAPEQDVEAQIISVYGSAVVNAAQNQVVVINRGSAIGLEPGHVLAIQKRGQQLVDRSQESPLALELPDERNGLAMVFLTFDKLSYALVVEISDTVRIGDRMRKP
ncbi:MAG: hypothetical protein WCK81_11055 [Betaproteobacteria bacterium]